MKKSCTATETLSTVAGKISPLEGADANESETFAF